MSFSVGNHWNIKEFDCLDCAERFYNELEGEKYLKNNLKNIIIKNTYGWKNGK